MGLTAGIDESSADGSRGRAKERDIATAPRSRSRSRLKKLIPEEFLQKIDDEPLKQKFQDICKELDEHEAKKRRLKEDTDAQAAMDAVKENAQASAEAGGQR